MKHKIKYATHNGVFHSDEFTATAVLKVVFPDGKLVRTRDKFILSECDIVYDVGAIYDPEKGRFDHHMPDDQKPRRDDETPYSSAGLIWREYGRLYIRKIANEIEDEKGKANRPKWKIDDDHALG